MALVDARQASLLQTVPLNELGARIRAARVAAGLTQTELGGPDVTVSYVSRIESGARRPDARVLEAFASRLGVSVDELLTEPVSEDERTALLAVDYVELSLELGEAQDALTQADRLLADAETPAYLRERVMFLRGRALEALGRLEDATDAFEQVRAAYPEGGLALQCAMALSRCYREAGDLGRAISAGETALAAYAERGLAGGDEAVQLTVTVAAAYHERGDVAYAVRLCREAAAVAEESGSPRSRAAAYWNASVMEMEKGAVASAVTLASKALALLGEETDVRSLGGLRSLLGIMQLQLDPPELADALSNLTAAREQLAQSGSGQAERLRNEVALAEAALIAGDFPEARAIASAAFALAQSGAPLVAANARAVEGQAAAAEGNMAEAAALYKEAVHLLTGVGADRSAGELWLELGALLESVGEEALARQAYRSAAAAAGLRLRSRAAVSIPVRSPGS
jgi:transcriptional regulator with XRE-family HTH domain